MDFDAVLAKYRQIHEADVSVSTKGVDAEGSVQAFAVVPAAPSGLDTDNNKVGVDWRRLDAFVAPENAFAPTVGQQPVEAPVDGNDFLRLIENQHQISFTEAGAAVKAVTKTAKSTAAKAGLQTPPRTTTDKNEVPGAPMKPKHPIFDVDGDIISETDAQASERDSDREDAQESDEHHDEETERESAQLKRLRSARHRDPRNHPSFMPRQEMETNIRFALEKILHLQQSVDQVFEEQQLIMKQLLFIKELLGVQDEEIEG